MSTGGATNRRISLGGAMIQTPKPDYSTKAASLSRPGSRKSDRSNQSELNSHLDDGFTGLSTGRSL